MRLQHALWVGGGSIRNILSAWAGDRALGRAEAALDAVDLDSFFVRETWSGVGITIMVGTWGRTRTRRSGARRVEAMMKQW